MGSHEGWQRHLFHHLYRKQLWPWESKPSGSDTLQHARPIICGGKWHWDLAKWCHRSVLTYGPWRAVGEGRYSYLIWTRSCNTSNPCSNVKCLGAIQETWYGAGASSCYCFTVIKPASYTCLYNPAPWGKQPSWSSPEISFVLKNEAG